MLLSFAGTAARPRHRGQALRAATPSGALQTGGGFAPCEALCRRVAGVSHPCMA